MPIWFFQATLAVAILLTVVSGTWLLLHATSVARHFHGSADVVASPVPGRQSGAKVRLWLALFGLGTVLSLAVTVMILFGAAQSVNVPGG